MRVKFVKPYKRYRKGDLAEVTPNEGFGFIDGGYAILHKMIDPQEVIERAERINKRKHG